VSFLAGAWPGGPARRAHAAGRIGRRYEVTSAAVAEASRAGAERDGVRAMRSGEELTFQIPSSAFSGMWMRLV